MFCICIGPHTVFADFKALKPFLDHETHSFKHFEEVLTSYRYCTVPATLAQTYGALCAPSIEVPDKPVVNVIVKPPFQVFMTVLPPVHCIVLMSTYGLLFCVPCGQIH